MTTDGGMLEVEEVVCRELVELVTDYLERALSPGRRALVEEHLLMCEPCRDYVEQMRRTARALRGIRIEELSADSRRELLDMFASWADGASG